MGIMNLRKAADKLELISESKVDTEFVEEWHKECLERLQSFDSTVATLFAQNTTKKQLRALFRTNLFILLVCGCKRFDMLTEWCRDRCAEVQASPNGHLDLWPREFYKSTIITFGKSIQDIIITHGDDIGLDVTPVTIGIFSFTRPIAKAFLRQIKMELEQNEIIKYLFNDVFYVKPQSQSPKWSEDQGLIVKRKTNPKESTVEAWGLIESQPTSKHFQICMYDDMITKDTVLSSVMIKRSKAAWEDSINLSTEGGFQRYIGTRKHFNDVYSLILEREAAINRLYLPFKADGTPNMSTKEYLDAKRRKMGHVTWAAEMMQNPLVDNFSAFDKENVWHHQLTDTSKVNLYMVCDAANSKRKESDYTVYFVLGIDADKNALLVDGIRDRLNLSERWEAFSSMYAKYPAIIQIYYEEVGMQSDIEYFTEKMNQLGRYFRNKIIKLNPKEFGAKEERIGQLEPWFTEHRLLFPNALNKQRTNCQPYNLIKELVEEEMAFYPVGAHDDMLDVLAYFILLANAGRLTIPGNSTPYYDNMATLGHGPGLFGERNYGAK